MPTLYGRRIEVEIAGLLISEPRISLEIERSINPTQDKGEVAIFNLRNENADRIFRRGGPVLIRAGYPETVAVIYEGTAQRIRRAREGLAFVTRIKLGDMVHSSRRLAGTFKGSYAGQYPVREIAVDIISLGMGLLAGPLQAIPERATFNNFYWAGGPATAALTALLRPLGLTWFEQDGIVRVNRRDMLQADAPAIRKDPKTGLVGSVMVTDEGAECRMFLDGRVVLGSRLTLDDGKPRGTWKVVGVRHVADNWEASSFLTECDLRSAA